MSLPLRDAGLLRQQALIDGIWTDGSAIERLIVVDPSRYLQLADLPSMSIADYERAIAAADAAGGLWRRRTAGERADILLRWHALVLENRDDLALILTSEQGKPLSEARAEIDYGAAYIRWYAEEARRITGFLPPGHRLGARLSVTKEPVGVVAAITPWNFPNAMVTRKVAPALAAGCSVVLKPASATPLSALALAELACRAGVPAGVFSVLPSRRAAEAGQVLATSPLVRKLTFTGSTEIGRVLLAQAASTIKKTSMELGGNAPALVFEGADLDVAVRGLIDAKFRNAGQTCVCANRIYVQAPIYDAFAVRLAKAVAGLTVGDGRDEGARIGPLIDGAARRRICGLIDSAVSGGARIMTGGAAAPVPGGQFLAPTVLSGVSHDMEIARTEIFGPVAPLIRFGTESEAIALANDSIHGLAAYVFDRDPDRLVRVTEALEAGMIGVNTGQISTELAPFGGVKQSGLGREGGQPGIEDYLELKFLCAQVQDA